MTWWRAVALRRGSTKRWTMAGHSMAWRRLVAWRRRRGRRSSVMEGRRVATSRPGTGSRPSPVGSAPLLEDPDEGGLPLQTTYRRFCTCVKDQSRRVARANSPDANGTRSGPVGVARTPCPPSGGIPPRPRRPAAHLQNKRRPPRACGPSDPASFQSAASLENIDAWSEPRGRDVFHFVFKQQTPRFIINP